MTTLTAHHLFHLQQLWPFSRPDSAAEAAADARAGEDFFAAMGAVPVSGKNLYRLLEAGETALLFPGGVREAYKRKARQHPTPRRARSRWHGSCRPKPRVCTVPWRGRMNDVRPCMGASPAASQGEKYRLFWPSRPEFVRMAIKFGATVVPFSAVRNKAPGSLLCVLLFLPRRWRRAQLRTF